MLAPLPVRAARCREKGPGGAQVDTSSAMSGQASIGDEHVTRNEIAMGHHVWSLAARQIPHGGPHSAKARNVDEALTVPEADFHPRVVRWQIASATAAAECPATRVDGAHVVDELGEIVREPDRSTRVTFGGYDARYPRLDRPRKRVAVAGLAERDRLRCRESCTTPQLEGCFRLGRQPASRRPGVVRPEREPGRETVADAENRVDRPRRGDRPDGHVPPLGELIMDQVAGHLRRHDQLVGMHPHAGSLARPVADRNSVTGGPGPPSAPRRRP